jgi:hypothetical protein
MPVNVPVSDLIQFVPTGGTFYVDTITDPGGKPSDVLDVDQGFNVTGRVTLPNWLSGKGKVCIYADEQGGPIDQELSPCHDMDLKGEPGEPHLVKYDWEIMFPASPPAPAPVLPDPQPGASQVYRLIAVFRFGDQLTDIATFCDMGTYMIN